MIMRDADLEVLSYNLRTAYVDQIYNSTGQGALSVGSTYDTIGSAENTIASEEVNSYTYPEYLAAGNSYPPYPTIGLGTTVTYDYQQNRNYPSFPSDSVLDSDGFVYFQDSDGNGNGILQLRTANTAAQIYDEVLTHCLTEMKTGDEVGTYRVSTSTPSSGGAGTWVNRTTWFEDTRYVYPGSAPAIRRLYLKTALSSPPTGSVLPLGLRAAGSDTLKPKAIGKTDNLIQNVLLPALTRRIINGDLRYFVQNTTSSNILRGIWSDTRLTEEVLSQYRGPLDGYDGTYHSIATPDHAGGLGPSTINTYRLYLQS